MGQAELEELWEIEGEAATGLVRRDIAVGAVVGAGVAQSGTLDWRGREGRSLVRTQRVRKGRQKDRRMGQGVQPGPGGEGCVSGLVTGGRKATESKENGVNFGRGEPCRFGRDWAQTEPGFVRKKTVPQTTFLNAILEMVCGAS